MQEINLANIQAVLQRGKDCLLWATFRNAILCLLVKCNLSSVESRLSKRFFSTEDGYIGLGPPEMQLVSFTPNTVFKPD